MVSMKIGMKSIVVKRLVRKRRYIGVENCEIIVKLNVKSFGYRTSAKEGRDSRITKTRSHTKHLSRQSKPPRTHFLCKAPISSQP